MLKWIQANKKVIFSIIITAVICFSAGVIAEALISADAVSYSYTGTTKTNVKDSLDELYNEVDTGKTNIINSLNSKGLELSNNATYQDIKNGIDTLPIGKTDSGEWGLKDNENNFVSTTNTDMYFETIGIVWGNLPLSDSNIKRHSITCSSLGGKGALTIYLDDGTGVNISEAVNKTYTCPEGRYLKHIFFNGTTTSTSVIINELLVTE